MKTLAAICVDRPVFAAMIVLSLVVVGAASYFRLGIDRFPRVDLPQIAVRTSLPGASVQETEVQVTEPMEEAMNTVEGIDELRSVTGAGASNVFAVFGLNRDIDVAAQDVRDRIGPVMRQLPSQALDRSWQFNADSSPAMSVAGEQPLGRDSPRSPTRSSSPESNDRRCRRGRHLVGLERAINIWVDADRLSSMQLHQRRAGGPSARTRTPRRQCHVLPRDGPAHRPRRESETSTTWSSAH
jgi:HAE1 family hydrophobic/amphiphilic exporter-1